MHTMDEVFRADDETAKEMLAAGRAAYRRGRRRGTPRPFRMAGWAAFNAATYRPTHRADR